MEPIKDLETIKRINAMLDKRFYKGFCNKNIFILDLNKEGVIKP